jgi:LAO/AO transport system kinase
LQVPGSGDGVQALKAGLLEVADLYVVNKADLPGAELLVRELNSIAMLGFDAGSKARSPKVVKVSAASGDGVEKLIAEIEKLGATVNDARSTANTRMARAEIAALVTDRVRRSIEAEHGEMDIEPLVAEVAQRRLSPRNASEIVLNRLGTSASRR